MGDPVTMAVVSAAVGSVQAASSARAQRRAQQQALNRQIQQRRMQDEMRAKQEREKAKVQQASARASFGARGVSSTGGSANALIDGIEARSEEAIAEQQRLSDFGIDTLRENAQAQSRQNMLQTRNSIFSTVLNTGGRVAKNLPGS